MIINIFWIFIVSAVEMNTLSSADQLNVMRSLVWKAIKDNFLFVITLR